MELINQIHAFGFAKADIINCQEQQLLLEMVESIHSANLRGLGQQPQSIFSALEPDIHTVLGQKKYRFFNESQISEIKNTQFFKLLSEKLGKNRISRKAVGGKFTSISGDEEIYFRLVRPFTLSDVGAPHADSWYHKIYGEEASEDLANSFKVWIPILPESGVASLSIAPKSNIQVIGFETYKKNGAEVPGLPDQYLQEMKLQPIPMNAGELLIFPPETIHCGMVNYGAKTRVSIEITLI